MVPRITVKKTFLGDTITLNYAQETFLRQNIDLGPFLFGKSLKSYFSLPSGDFKGELFNSKHNKEKTKLIVAQVEKHNLLLSLKKSWLSGYFYLFTEVGGVQLLFTIRFSTEITKKSRKQWAKSVNLPDYNCCFRNYYKDFNLNYDFKALGSDEVIADIKVLNQNCYYKRQHVEVKPAIWAYIVNQPTSEEVEGLSINCPIRYNHILGGLPSIPGFAYGSGFKTIFEQQKDAGTPLCTGNFEINCKLQYQNLHEKKNFESFVVDSWNNVSYYMSLIRDQKFPEQELPYQLLGCSFIFEG